MSLDKVKAGKISKRRDIVYEEAWRYFNQDGKPTRNRKTGSSNYKSDFKKAIVTLKTGDTIEVI